MQCSNCGETNRDDAAFCSTCGTALVSRCPVCSAPYTPGDVFCSSCGNRLSGDAPGTEDKDLARYIPAELQAKLEAARAGRTMAGERRTVTMLFADIQGSTAAAEQLDPEEWADVVNGAFEHLIKPVYRFEGTLARLMGDAVLAFFGAPIAHEDDPERAVLAGLEMLAAAGPYAREVKARWGIDFDLRVGINTGLVVVGEVGSDLRVEYSALGDAVNVAARMEQTALPGTLQVTGETHRLVAQLFEFEELEPVSAKGKSDLIQAFRVLGVRERPSSTRGIIGRDAPLVGRDRELGMLRSVIDDVRQGKGQVCSIIGEAGVGKSRLAAALKADLAAASCLGSWLEAQPEQGAVQWAEARCLSYNTSVAYAPFVDLFTRVFSIDPEDPDDVSRSKVATVVERRGVEDAAGAVVYLCSLLGVDPGGGEADIVAALPAPELQRRIFAAVSGWVEACSRSAPTVLLVEDLHWADAVSLALLEELMRTTDRSMLSIIVLTRPYREDASWRFHETAERDFAHRYTAIRLRPLDTESAVAMVDGLLGGHGVPEGLKAAILARAEGNPFFVEEILRVMLESGTLKEEGGTWILEGDPVRASLSGGVSGLLTARLDRLEDFSKLVAQFASVLGREFEFGELASLVGDEERTDEALADLLRRDLLVEQARIPSRTYAFRHALIQETAYSTILLKSRRSLHATVAERLIAGEAPPQETARHLLESKQEARAVPYLVDAGDQATRSMSLADAIRFYDEALEWMPETGSVELIRRIHEGLGAAYTLIPDLSNASAAYQRLLELGRKNEEPSLQIAALNRLGFTTALLGGDYDLATEHLEEARRLAQDVGDGMGLAEYHMNSCMIATTRGDMEKAAAHDAETTRLGSEVGSPMLVVGGSIQRALSLAHATRYEEGLRALEQAKKVVGDSTNPLAVSGLAGAEYFYLTREGRIAEALERATTAAELAAHIGSSTASVAYLEAGQAAFLAGDLEGSLAFYARSRQLGEQGGQLFNAAASTAGMVHVYVGTGQWDEATAELADVALGYLETPMGETLASTVFAELGWSAIERADLREAASLLGRGLAGSSASKLLETPRLLLGLATVRIAEGDLEAAEGLIAEADEFVSERAMVHLAPYVAMTRGSLLLAAGRTREAAEVLGDGASSAAGSGIIGMEWRLRAARSSALARDGLHADAAEEAVHARRLVVDQANRMADAEMRERFQAVAMAQFESLVTAG